MSAPHNAITLQQEAETEWIEGPENKGARRMLRLGVSCSCGFKGVLGELLCDSDDDTPNNFWCPYCRSHGWGWD